MAERSRSFPCPEGEEDGMNGVEVLRELHQVPVNLSFQCQ